MEKETVDGLDSIHDCAKLYFVSKETGFLVLFKAVLSYFPFIFLIFNIKYKEIWGSSMENML